LQIARKVAVSLLVCVLLFAGVCIFAFTNLFNIAETRFYDRAVLNGLNGELAAYTDLADGYLDGLQNRFSGILREDAVKNSFAVNRTGEDIYERGRILDLFGLSLPELLWTRFVDSSGNRIQYSTNLSDQIPADSGAARYRDYPDVPGYIPFDQQLLSGVNLRRIVFDEKNALIIFYFPFYDSMGIRRGEAMFAVPIRAFGERLIGSARIRVTDDVSIVSNPDGIVIGIPQYKTSLLKNAIVSVWTSGGTGPGRLYTPNSESLAILSAKTGQGVFVGLAVPEKLFLFPASLKALLIGSVFITLFVIFFLAINMKQDAVAVVQSRLKELQVSLMHEYYQLMGDMDWAVWRRELEQRRDDVRNELCRGIKIKKGSDIEGYINSFFNRSWDGLLAAIGSRTGMITTFDEAKLEAILSRILSSARPSGSDYDYEFQTPKYDDYDIEEFPSADAPSAGVPVAGDGQSGYTVKAGERYGDNALPDAEAGGFDEFEELGEADPDARFAGGMRADDWRELGEAGGTENASGQFYSSISLSAYSPKNMYASLRGSPDWTAASEFAEQDENLPELYGNDDQSSFEADEGAWLKSAGETVVIKPPKKTALDEAVKPSAFSANILEKDHLEEEVLAAKPVSGDGEPSYGDFIRGAPTAAPHNIFVKLPPETEAAEGGEPVIKKDSRGIDYINSAALTDPAADANDIDPEMKRLVESVLRKPAGS
jgi:hypothetical protein